jgi:hypothetical protein
MENKSQSFHPTNACFRAALIFFQFWIFLKYRKKIFFSKKEKQQKKKPFRFEIVFDFFNSPKLRSQQLEEIFRKTEKKNNTILEIFVFIYIEEKFCAQNLLRYLLFHIFIL